MSGSDENDWIKIDMAETGKLQILKTNWNQVKQLECWLLVYKQQQ